MDINTAKLLLSIVVVISAKDIPECDKTALYMEMEVCGEQFKTDMAELNLTNQCNIAYFIREYDFFTTCTETIAVKIGCFWPHPVVEHYIILIHEQFFSNCTHESMVGSDFEELIVNVIIIFTVFLTLAIVAIVAWFSKQS
ncbi:receptor activity-modifying protein 3 isoform 1-T2 [Clarias gariepinus]|uniref:receptor activity-modifying protein 3-like n=1 Tax=Clarias gariepinus TaxID=13013 RepID=UPI00234CA741|nr:receptor activity-modifying protein 3-like [Clarias gariepinus]